MPYRSPARWLAPAALVAAALAVVIVVSSRGDSEPSSSPAPRERTTTTATSRTVTTEPRRSTYTVKAGDVLSAIAAENGLTVEQLQNLNPDVDAQTLRPGQKLRLSR